MATLMEKHIIAEYLDAYRLYVTSLRFMSIGTLPIYEKYLSAMKENVEELYVRLPKDVRYFGLVPSL